MQVLLAECQVACQEGAGGAAIPHFAMPVWKGSKRSLFRESRERRGVYACLPGSLISLGEDEGGGHIDILYWI